jgi:protein TonB
MQATQHAIATARPKGMTPERVTGLVFAGLLQAALIFALVEGLNIKVRPTPGTGTEIDIIKDSTKTGQLPPPPISLHQPTVTTQIAPVFHVESGETPQGITLVQGPAQSTGIVFAPATAIGDTHTTPPYPPLALRLGEEGSVQLRLTISTQGIVTDAALVRSSGYVDLDQAARGWILAHWRYRPAIRAGAAVPSASDVQVRFDLKNAH